MARGVKKATGRDRVKAIARATRRKELAAGKEEGPKMYRTVLRIDPKLAQKFKKKIEEVNKGLGVDDKRFSVNSALTALIESFIAQ